MSTALQTLTSLSARTVEYIAAAKAPASVRAYRADWAHFESWCREASRNPLPSSPDTVALYLTAHAGLLTAATLTRRLVTINKAHLTAGLPAPASTSHQVVGETLKGIRRTHGTKQTQKRPLMAEGLRTVVKALPATLAGKRDRAILLLGFAGAFRRSELAALQVEDLRDADEGLLVQIRSSKTDQEGAGRQVAIPFGRGPTCPVRAVKDYLTVAALTSGPLFRGINRGVIGDSIHPDSIGYIVKRAVESVGMDPDEFAGHSLRAGLCTEAYRNGARTGDIMRQTGHKSAGMVQRYMREEALFTNNAAGKTGL